MSKIPQLVVGALVTFALSLPGAAWGQAVPRGSGGSSGGGSGSSGSSGGDSGSGSQPSSPERPRMRTPAPPPMPRGSRTAPESRRPANGAPTVAGDNGNRPNTQGESRNRDGRPSGGFAIPRNGSLRGGAGSASVNIWNPWYGGGPSWYSGYSPYYGYSLYDPFFYGSSRLAWGRYGIWYDPFDPFSYSGLYAPGLYAPGAYGIGGGYSSYGDYGYGGGDQVNEPAGTGSVRIRVKPGNAKVYLDGTLMGTVDEFDGLTTHLAAPAGPHRIKIEADGYAPLELPVDVEADKTVTTRGSLKKQ